MPMPLPYQIPANFTSSDKQHGDERAGDRKGFVTDGTPTETDALPVPEGD